MFAVFIPVGSKISNSLAMFLLIDRILWAVLGMQSVSFLLLPLISRTALLFGFDLGRLTECVFRIGYSKHFVIKANKKSFCSRQNNTFRWHMLLNLCHCVLMIGFL